MSLREAYTAAKAHTMTTRARVLTFDIERRPGVYLSWDNAPRFLGRERQLVRSSTISFAAKWYGEKPVIFDSISHGNTLYSQPEHVAGYRDMLVHIRDLIDVADIVVGFNSLRFDEKKLRGEWARMGITPPSPYRSLDLIKTVRRMGWDYNSLAESLDAFGLGSKLAHQGFTLWTDCLTGDVKAWRVMEKYNKVDVVQTERLMDALRPWIHDHPNLGLWAGHDESGAPVEVCANCGSDRLRTVPERFAVTALTAYGLVQCADCQAYMRRNHVKERVALRPVR